jgi:hypothetical protein
MRPLGKYLARLEKSAARSEVAELPALVLPQEGELDALVAGLVRTFQAEVEAYKEHHGLTHEEAVAKANAPCPGAESNVRRVPPDRVSWGDLQILYRGDPGAAMEKWMQIRKVAIEELRCGLPAACAVKPHFESPWWLAQFLAVRDALAADLQPRTGCESLLIDQAAQTYTQLMYWQEELVSCTAMANVGSRREAGREKLRLDDAQAIKLAKNMVDSLNAMFVRTVRALQETHRGRPAVVVKRASQVNVGQHQVNLNAPKE